LTNSTSSATAASNAAAFSDASLISRAPWA
jgi:hypothetical protein